MKTFYTFWVVLFGMCSFTFGQTYDVNHQALRLVDSAKVAFCNGDTSLTIATLERFEKQFPTDALIVSTNRALSELYFAKGDVSKAKSKLVYALTYQPSNYPAYRESDDCDKILKRQDYARAKADLCVDLSRIYLAQQQFDSSYCFLNLADNEYLPYKDCGNGISMYKSHLSTYYADYYLATGDTSKAIARLLDFFMKPGGNTKLLTEKLKSILLQKWTQEQIRQEIDKGLRELKFTKTNEDGFVITLTLFGHKIQDFGYGKVKSYKDLYKRDPSLKMLGSD